MRADFLVGTSPEVSRTRPRECNFISLMDFDARDCNPLFFACRGTENWIIYGFEVMKGNLTCGGRPALAGRSDNFKNRVRLHVNAEKQEGKKKGWRERRRRRRENTANGGNNDGNPDNSRTTQLLYHNRPADFELSWHGRGRLAGANKLARSKEGRADSFYLSINRPRILVPFERSLELSIPYDAYYELIQIGRAHV